MRQPLVSICVPTCNRASLLRKTLATIRSQTYEPLEILICDNASSDETESIGRQAQAEDPRIRCVRHPRNIGLYPNHNACIEMSRGEFLCLFHDDELYGPNFVTEYVDFFNRHPEVGLVCSDWNLIDDAEQIIGSREFGGSEVLPWLKYI